jgi:hypothetical protein
VGEQCQFLSNDLPGCTNAGKARVTETGARQIASYLTRICRKVALLSRFCDRFIQSLTGSWMEPLHGLDNELQQKPVVFLGGIHLFRPSKLADRAQGNFFPAFQE